MPRPEYNHIETPSDFKPIGHREPSIRVPQQYIQFLKEEFTARGCEYDGRFPSLNGDDVEIGPSSQHYADVDREDGESRHKAS